PGNRSRLTRLGSGDTITLPMLGGSPPRRNRRNAWVIGGYLFRNARGTRRGTVAGRSPSVSVGSGFESSNGNLVGPFTGPTGSLAGDGGISPLARIPRRRLVGFRSCFSERWRR